jgi:hypothetical protein
MKKKLICVPDTTVKHLLWRFGEYLDVQQKEITYLKQELEEIKKTVIGNKYEKKSV